MSYQIKPLGTTAVPGWQHRLSRGNSFGEWQDYDASFEGFGTDPQTGGDITAGVTYWLYARNVSLPPEREGSDQQQLAAAIVVTPEGRVESLSPGAVLCESADSDTPGGGDATTIGGVPVSVFNPTGGQFGGFITLPNGQVVFANTPLPSLKQQAQQNPNIDTDLRLGNTQQFDPVLVENVQRVRVSFFTGVVEGGKQLFAHAEITMANFLKSVKLSLNDVLAAGNVSKGTAVFGGWGTFARPLVPEADSIVVPVPAEIAGEAGHYYERMSFTRLLDLLFLGASPSQLNYIRTRLSLSAPPPFLATVTGAACAVEDEAPVLNEWAEFDLTAIADGASITHALNVSNGFLQDIYDYNGRHYAGAHVTAATATTFTFQHPGITDPFTGTLRIKPKA